MNRPLAKMLTRRVQAHLGELGYSDEQIARLWPAAMIAAPAVGGIVQWLLDHAGQILDLVLTIFSLFAAKEAPANPVAA